MAKAPARRYGTAGGLADDLRRFLKHEPIQARPVNNVERFWRWSCRNPALAALSASVAVLLAAVAVGGWGTAVREYWVAENEKRLRTELDESHRTREMERIRADLATMELSHLREQQITSRERPSDRVNERVAEIKAAYLYNFALYVAWPAGAGDGDSFVIGEIGRAHV